MPYQLLLAPMAGFTDRVFRRLCRQLGCAATYTEMISAQGLCYGAKATRALLIPEPGENRICQLFGHDEGAMAEAAAIVAASGHFQAIDINMGCPVRKITGAGEGSALMQTPFLAARLVRAVHRAGLPVTVKMRLGWDESSINALGFAQQMIDAGAASVCLHARTRVAGYAGRADWQAIAKLKAAVNVPVYASGDIWTPQDADAVHDQTGCDGVLAARGALGNPWFFSRTSPTLEERTAVMLRHARDAVEAYGPRALVSLRAHLAYYTRGLPGAAAFRRQLSGVGSPEELEAAIAVFLAGD